jgi:hypothetical protein
VPGTPGRRAPESQRRDQPGWDRVVQWDGNSLAGFFEDTADACTAQLDPGLAGYNGREFATTPLGMDGTVLQGVLINEAIEVLCQLARDFGRSPGAWAVNEALCALVGKAMDPLAQGGIGEGQRLRDRLEALAFDDVAYRLGTAEDARFLRLLQAGVSRGEGVIGKVQCEGAHTRGLQNKVLQKCTNMVFNIRGLPSYRNKTFSPQISQELLIMWQKWRVSAGKTMTFACVFAWLLPHAPYP